MLLIRFGPFLRDDAREIAPSTAWCHLHDAACSDAFERRLAVSRHGAFANSKREVIRAFHLLSELDRPGCESGQRCGGATRSPQGRDRWIGWSAHRRVRDE